MSFVPVIQLYIRGGALASGRTVQRLANVPTQEEGIIEGGQHSRCGYRT